MLLALRARALLFPTKPSSAGAEQQAALPPASSALFRPLCPWGEASGGGIRRRRSSAPLIPPVCNPHATVNSASNGFFGYSLVVFGTRRFNSLS